MHSIQIPNLYEPSSYPLHDLPSCFQPFPPVGLPFQEITRIQGIGAEFKETAKRARRCGRPKGELLHQRSLFGGDEFFELLVEGGEVGMGGDRVKRGMIPLIALIFPDVD